MKKKKYNYLENNKLESYIRSQYKNLSNSAMILYLFGLQKVETQQIGLCKPITANHSQLAEASLLSAPTVGKCLLSLHQSGLIEYFPGEQGKRTGNASRIRRRSIDELAGDHKTRLTDYTTAQARQIADILNQRIIIFNNEEFLPKYNPKSTGRLYATGKLANKSESYLKSNLSKGMQTGEHLIYADYSKAEPTILKYVLEQRGFKATCKDPYKLLSEHLDIKRSKAKQRVNSLAYSKSAIAIIKHWNLPRDRYFCKYANAIDDYKEHLWNSGKPVKNKILRHCRTLGNTLIEKPRSKTIHKGNLLNWQIQGTVADIMNNVVLELIKLEKKNNWQFLIPVHDAVYLKAGYDCSIQLSEIMEKEAEKLNIPLKVKIEKIVV